MRYKILILSFITTLAAAASDFDMNFSATLQANGGPHDFAPYYIASMRHGTLTSATGAHLGLKAWKPIDLSKRFSYSFGAEAWFNGANSVDYQRFNFDEQTWFTHSVAPSAAFIHQLWGEVKFRGVFLTAGLRDFSSALLNQRLSSGDLIESGNSRNIPQVRVGFIDFQNIPFTNGWVQIQGEVSFGKSTDNDWSKKHFNYYSYHMNLGWWYHYKRCYFRTKPEQPFSVTVGLQTACQFGGTSYNYSGGLMKDGKYGVPSTPIVFRNNFKALLDAFLIRTDASYVSGNYLGSWDFQARYRFRNNAELKAYFSWLWEDGSGIGKMNGMDGLWGLEYKAARTDAPLSAAVVEVMTYMNQGGPMHYSPSDYTNPTLTGKKTEGSDNYYNNHQYNGYAVYGMAIGSPMFISPVYNVNGQTTRFLNNRFWGIHAAVEGRMTDHVRYRAMASFRRFFGMMFIPSIHPTHDVSAFFEAQWMLPQLPGLELAAQLAADYGTSPLGRSFGALLSARYSFNVNFTKKICAPINY